MSTLSEELDRTLTAIETGVSRAGRDGFAARALAIESLDVHVFDRLPPSDPPADLHALHERATALGARLAAANEQVLQRLRTQIRSRRCEPATLKRAIALHAGTTARRGGYDVLDRFVGELLDAGAPSEERAVREPEMVAYQPTPARAILALVERAAIRPSDVFYDLGSGLGQVVILVALSSGARSRGVEFEPAHCEYARRSAHRLNVAGVDFIEADVRDAPLDDGTVFFLFTPFRGAMLQKVMERLRAEAATRPIRVCSYGPCTAEIASASWLRRRTRGELDEHDVHVFVSAR
jgi:hypothetical protein